MINISVSLGSLIAGKSPRDALKFAALSGVTGGALSKFGGLQAGQGLGGLLGKSVPGQTLGAAGSGLAPGSTGALTQAVAAQAPKQSVLGSIINFAKANPLKTASAVLGLGALAGAGDCRSNRNLRATVDPSARGDRPARSGPECHVPEGPGVSRRRGRDRTHHVPGAAAP